jgi:ATP-independent RNA helicase DbpA
VTSHKEKTLTEIIETYQPKSMLLFCNTKADVITLSHTLQKQGHAVIALHGDIDQNERNEAIILFANGSRPLMVATDVASRGLDIDDIELIVNYDLPFDEEVYTHRIGRTGRAGATGTAVSLYTPGSQKTEYILNRTKKMSLSRLKHSGSHLITSSYETICINGGKRTKLRAGDILGTFCKEIGIDNSQIGKITITENRSYVALHGDVIEKVCSALEKVKIKKRKYKAWVL